MSANRTLSMVWALEESDHMHLPVDILHPPEVEPTLIPTTTTMPACMSSIKRGPRGKSLANLRRDHALSLAKLQGQSFCNEIDADPFTSMTKCGLPPETNTISSSFLAGAASLGLRRRRNKATSEHPMPPNAHCIITPPKSTHLTHNNVKEEVNADDKYVVTESQTKLIEVALVPYAPRKPQSEHHRKRPPIRGVAVLKVCT